VPLALCAPPLQARLQPRTSSSSSSSPCDFTLHSAASRLESVALCQLFVSPFLHSRTVVLAELPCSQQPAPHSLRAVAALTPVSASSSPSCSIRDERANSCLLNCPDCAYLTSAAMANRPLPADKPLPLAQLLARAWAGRRMEPP
jgi:hypothetical protein